MAGLDTLSEQEQHQAWERYERIRPCLDADVPATAVGEHKKVGGIRPLPASPWPASAPAGSAETPDFFVLSL